MRTLAVAAVLAYHGGLSWASGGFLGVDAFFVLSGYLITTLLLAEWTSTAGRIDLVAFWGRRVRRLLPALLLMVTAVAVCARALLPPEEVRLLRGDGLAAVFYVANWRMIFRGGDYFAQTAAPSPLEHTWSLGIEEQFYLLWPLLLCAVLWLRPFRSRQRDGAQGSTRTRLRRLLVVCVAGAAASTAALAATYSAEDLGRAYYGTDTRGASILIGAGLATLLALRAESNATRRRGNPVGGPVGVTSGGPHAPGGRDWAHAVQVGFFGLAVLAGAAVTLACLRLSGDDAVLYRGGMAALALSVAVVIAHVAMVPAGVPARLLSIPPLPAIGRMSYGIYLWHWPVFLAVNAERTGLQGLRLFTVRCLVTLAIASASYLLVEHPIRTRLHVRRPLFAVTGTALVAAAASALLVAVTAVPGLPTGPRPGTPAAALDRFLAEDGHEDSGWAGKNPMAVRKTANALELQRRPPVRERRPGEPVVVDVFGDSVAWTLVTYLPRHPELDVRDRTLMGCGVTRTAPYRYFGRLYPHLMPACQQWPKLWRAAIARDNPHVAFILVGRWETMDRVLDGQWTHIGEPDYDAHLRAELELAISVAGARGAQVLLATEPYNRRGEQRDGSLFPEDEPHRVTEWNRLLREVASRHPNVRVIEFGARVSPQGRFTWSAGDVQVRSDGLHLTVSGVRDWIAPWLLPQLVAAAATQN